MKPKKITFWSLNNKLQTFTLKLGLILVIITIFRLIVKI